MSLFRSGALGVWATCSARWLCLMILAIALLGGDLRLSAQEPIPTEPAPTEPMPTEPMPQEPAPADPMPAEPMPMEPVAPTDPAAPQDPMPQDPMPQEPMPVEPMPQEPMPTEPMPMDPAAPTDPAAPQDPMPTEPMPAEPMPQDPMPMEPAVPQEAPMSEGTQTTAEPTQDQPPSPPPAPWNEAFQWRMLGPTTFGGRIVDIEVDPQDSSVIYAASGSGGLWKTVNQGTTWNCIFSQQSTTSIGDIAIAPSAANIVYVGTGEANNQRSSYWGDGVYRSDDGGNSWRHLGLNDSHHIARVVVNPRDPNHVVVAAMGHLYTSNETRGIFVSRDGGANWQKTLYVGPSVGATEVIFDPHQPTILYAATYERSRRPWEFIGAGLGSGIWKSVDGGSTWRRLAGGLPSGKLGRIGLSVFPADPRKVVAVVPNAELTEDAVAVGEVSRQEDGTLALPWGLRVRWADAAAVISQIEKDSPASRAEIPNDRRLIAIGDVEIVEEADLNLALQELRPGDRFRVTFSEGEGTASKDVTLPAVTRREIGNEIYWSEDSGETWKKVNETTVGGDPDYYYGQIRFDPVDSQRIYVLGVPLFGSTDGGKTWKDDLADQVHVDHHALWINPANPKHLLLGNDGGFHVSHDRGETWDHHANLPLSQFYAIGVDHQVPYHVYGGTQDNGTWGGPSRSRNPDGIPTSAWYRVGGGDGFYVQVDPRNSEVVLAESQFGALFRRHKASGDSKWIRPPQSDAETTDRYNWNSPLVQSVHDERVVYYGANRLFRSRNLGDDWETISPDLTTRDAAKIAGNVPHCTITTIAESPRNRSELLVGTDDGRLQWTTDGGKSWRDVTSRLPFSPQGWWATRVVLSRHADKTAYASFSGYREDDFRPFLFRTQDSGETWESLGSGLPDEPINVVIEDPRHPKTLYVGTDFGVHASVDGGITWQRLGKGLPRLAVHDLLIHPREGDLIAGTHAQGFFVIDDISPLSHWTDAAAEETAKLWPVRSEILWSRMVEDETSGSRRWYGQNPTVGVRITYRLARGVSEEAFSLTVLNAEGKEMAKLEAPRDAGVHRVEWSFRGERPGRGRRRGGDSPVVPGNYTVVLKVGEVELKETFEIQADPNRQGLLGEAR